MWPHVRLLSAILQPIDNDYVYIFRLVLGNLYAINSDFVYMVCLLLAIL